MPISVQVGSSTYWLQPNGQWTQDQGGQKPLSGSALVAAQQAYAQQGGSGPGAGQGSGGQVTGAAGGGGAVPVPAPQAITMPGLSSSTRFGTYQSPSYVVGQSYAGPESSTYAAGGAVTPPAGTPAPSPGPTPPPTPTPSPAPSPSPRPGGGWGGQWSRGGLGRGGNDRGSGTVLSGGGNGRSGGLLGSGQGGGRTAAGASPDSGLIDLGSVGAGALGAAGLLPGWAGTAASLANLAGRAYNTAQVDSIRQQQGIPGLSVGQALSGLTGIGGDYGSLGGGTTIANPGQFTDRLNSLLADNRLYSGGGLPASSLAETNDGSDYNSFHLGPFALGTSTPALSYGLTQSLIDKVNAGTAIPYDTPTAYAPTGVAKVPSAPVGEPIMRSDGTIIGYVRPDGTATTPAAQAAMQATAQGIAALQKATGSMDGTRTGPATTAAMGGGYGGGSYSPGQAGGNTTGINGGGQADRAGFHRGGIVPGRPNGKVDDVPARLDQGEAVIQQPAAQALGRGLLSRLNDPKQARRIRGLLRAA
jgi:hypothetical protein